MATLPVAASARRDRTVGRRDIDLFSGITGDRIPIHYDTHEAAS